MVTYNVSVAVRSRSEKGLTSCSILLHERNPLLPRRMSMVRRILRPTPRYNLLRTLPLGNDLIRKPARLTQHNYI